MGNEHSTSCGKNAEHEIIIGNCYTDRMAIANQLKLKSCTSQKIKEEPLNERDISGLQLRNKNE